MTAMSQHLRSERFSGPGSSRSKCQSRWVINAEVITGMRLDDRPERKRTRPWVGGQGTHEENGSGKSSGERPKSCLRHGSVQNRQFCPLFSRSRGGPSRRPPAAVQNAASDRPTVCVSSEPPAAAPPPPFPNDVMPSRPNHVEGFRL